MGQVQFILNIYYNEKLSVDKKVEIIGNSLFKYSTKQLSKEFKCAKAVTFISMMNENLIKQTFDIIESSYYNPDFIVNLLDRDYDLLNKCIEKANEEFEIRRQRYSQWTKYDKVFKEWADLNVSKKKQIARHEANQVKKSIVLENPELFDFLKPLCVQFNCSVDLVCEIASKCLYLNTEKEYKFDLSSKSCLEYIREYCDKTDTKYYANEFDKITLIRSILHRLIKFIYKDEYEFKQTLHKMRKNHSRLILVRKHPITGTGFQSLNIYNIHYFIINIINHYYIMTNNIITYKYYHKININKLCLTRRLRAVGGNYTLNSS